DQFSTLPSKPIKVVLIFLGGDLRIEFAAHPHDRFFRDRPGHEKRLARHSEIALRIVRRHATLVAKGKADTLPRKVSRNPGEFRINRQRRVASRQRNSEFVAFGQRGPRVLQEKFRGFTHEILGANHLAFHARGPRARSRSAITRASRDIADDNLPPDKKWARAGWR